MTMEFARSILIMGIYIYVPGQFLHMASCTWGNNNMLLRAKRLLNSGESLLGTKEFFFCEYMIST
jgi:hypothetical protein